jgi:2-keto-3-deoxy-L-rhamnonate aldolase RhmA
MIYVGPYDFSISMGHPGDYDHPRVRKAMDEILKLCVKHGVPFGTTPSGPKAGTRWIARGCGFFELVDELTLIREGAMQAVAAYR